MNVILGASGQVGSAIADFLTEKKVPAKAVYSNWLMSVDLVKETGVLPSFYPADLKIEMNSPIDVAEFIANIISEGVDKSDLIELAGPEQYSANQVAKEKAKTRFH